MSPLPLASAGIGMTRITSWRSSGSCERRDATATVRASWSKSRAYCFTLERHRPPILPPMRRCPASDAPAASRPPPAAAPAARRQRRSSDWRTLAQAAALPLGNTSWRVLVALAFLVAAKLANVGVPLVLKELVDALALEPGDPRRCWWCRSALLVAYGAAAPVDHAVHRAARVRVRQGDAARGRARIALEVFRHLHALSPALPPRAPDRRHDARHRARHARHLSR